MTDEELLSSYRLTGKTDSFGRLYDRYIPLVYGVCLKYLQDADDAQDAVMQLFEDLLTKVLQHEIKTFRTWLYTVSKNHCLQILREKEHTVQVEFQADFMESDEILHLLDEDVADDDERVQALHKCLEQLPDVQRISITLFFMDELSYAEIVESTGYSLKSVKSYLQNGKRNLKICIEQNV
ncbi:MAG: sigma-70 family RNA polymerase sigma factor [Tannerella sp.]|jgi:RNA polymerase sigma-70 factor (ECF subfamily)|nr:sigma-70 family RNA polymerase sigma factor [Tannerella sp.]